MRFGVEYYVEEWPRERRRYDAKLMVLQAPYDSAIEMRSTGRYNSVLFASI